MTYLTGKHIGRRTLLKGVGAAIALPVLDAMRPALAASAKNGVQAYRVAVVYVPNGIIMKDWKVAETGKDFAFTRILKPLEPFREDIVVLSGLANNAANGDRGGGHAKATGSQLPLRHSTEIHCGTRRALRCDVRPACGAALGVGDSRQLAADRLR